MSHNACEDQGADSGVTFFLLPPWGSLMFLQRWVLQATWPMSICAVFSVSRITVRMLGLQMCIATSSFLPGLQGLNSCHQGCVASILLTEPSIFITPSPGLSEPHYVAQTEFELVVLLTQPPDCWELHGTTMSNFYFVVCLFHFWGLITDWLVGWLISWERVFHCNSD